MKIQYLRIGNYVYERYSDSTFVVVNINSEGIGYVDMRNISFKAIGRYSTDSVIPIPLTEEWLVKLGFEKHESIIADSFTKSISKSDRVKELCVYINKGNEYIHIREGENSYRTTEDTVTTLLNGDYHGRPFYVHSLQNLYFALTGEELTIKEQ